MSIRFTRLVGALSVSLLAATAAHAQSAGSLLLRGGVTQIRPNVSSGDLSAPSPAGTKIDIDSATQIGGGITMMLTDNVAVDLPLALPFKHDIVGAGAIAGSGKLGEVKALPITLLGQYRFMEATSTLRPIRKKKAPLDASPGASNGGMSW